MLSDNYPNVMDCKLCEMTFDRFVDLENHIRTCHANHQVFHCDKCEKGFVLKWRLKKHMRLHTENNVTYCHYFNNDRNCPFEDLGCKFLHKETKNCPFKSNCTRRLCPYRHEVTRNTKDDNNESDENVEMSDIIESDKLM